MCLSIAYENFVFKSFSNKGFYIGIETHQEKGTKWQKSGKNDGKNGKNGKNRRKKSISWCEMPFLT